MGVIADEKILTDGDPGGAKLFHFFQKSRRIDHDSVGDDRAQMRLEHAGRQQRELEGFSILDDGVAGVGASVEANDDVMLVGEEIDDFAFGLVAPLQADDTGAGHCLTYSGRLPVRGIPGLDPVWNGPQKTPATPEVPGDQSGAW